MGCGRFGADGRIGRLCDGRIYAIVSRFSPHSYRLYTCWPTPMRAATGRRFAAPAEHPIGKARRFRRHRRRRPWRSRWSRPPMRRSSTCLALYPWANGTGRDAAVKLHLLLDSHGSTPASVPVTAESRPVDRGAGGAVRSARPPREQGAAPALPERLRRIRFHDADHRFSLVFWTNQLDLPASLIADLYRRHWQVELFFRRINTTCACAAFLACLTTQYGIQLWSSRSDNCRRPYPCRV